jgi:integrase
LKNLYGEKLDAGSSPRTVQYIHTTIHKDLKEAMLDGLVHKNVAVHTKLPKPRKKVINPLNPEQARAFLKAARGDRYEALYVLAVHYGLRQVELLGLKWSDVDLLGGVLQVRHTISETRSGRIEEQPKSGKGRVELTRSVSEALRSHQVRQQEESRGYGGLPRQWTDRLHRRHADELQEPLLALLQTDPRTRRIARNHLP